MPIKDFENTNGVFYIKHENKRIGVMFQSCYLKKEELRQYALERQVERFDIQRLEIAGRKRMRYLIVVDSPNRYIVRNPVVSDENGKFYISKNSDKAKIYPVMFVDQYADFHGISSKQLVEWKLENSDLKGLRVSKVTNNCINFVICDAK